MRTCTESSTAKGYNLPLLLLLATIHNHQPRMEQSSAGRKPCLGPGRWKGVCLSCQSIQPSHCPVQNRFAAGGVPGLLGSPENGAKVGGAPSSVRALFPESCAATWTNCSGTREGRGPCPLIHSAFTKPLARTMCGAVQRQGIHLGLEGVEELTW